MSTESEFISEETLIGQAQRLKDTGRFQDAEDLLTRGREAFRDSPKVAEAWAFAAHSLTRYDEAIERLKIATNEFPESLRLNQQLFDLLCSMQRSDEATAVLDTLDRLGKGTSISSTARLRLMLAKGNLEEAVREAADLQVRFPTELTGYHLGGATLRKLGRLEEAEEVLSSGLTQVGTVPLLLIELALTATAAGEWQLALDRLLDLRRLHPDWNAVKTALGNALVLWRLATVENDPKAIAVELPADFAESALTEVKVRMKEADMLPPAELVIGFESLGHGCEFGLVQRKFGAEPLGLLRWSNVNPSQLCAMLETRFDGVGSPEHSFVLVNGDEYFTGDSRYFLMHSFMKINQITENEVLAKSIMRMRYLKNKLLQDLDNGEKTFVYKAPGKPMSPDEIERIFLCFQSHYPKSSVLLVHQASEPAEVGVVRMRGIGLFESYLDKINVTEWLISHDLWLQVCRKVHALRTA